MCKWKLLPLGYWLLIDSTQCLIWFPDSLHSRRLEVVGTRKNVCSLMRACSLFHPLHPSTCYAANSQTSSKSVCKKKLGCAFFFPTTSSSPLDLRRNTASCRFWYVTSLALFLLYAMFAADDGVLWKSFWCPHACSLCQTGWSGVGKC